LFIVAGLTAGEVVRGAAGRVVSGVEFRDLLAMISSPNGSRLAIGASADSKQSECRIRVFMNGGEVRHTQVDGTEKSGPCHVKIVGVGLWAS
jgi:hypothetical protein